jgi:hypothetical protein
MCSCTIRGLLNRVENSICQNQLSSGKAGKITLLSPKVSCSTRNSSLFQGNQADAGGAWIHADKGRVEIQQQMHLLFVF